MAFIASSLFTIVAFVFVIGVLIILHEGGHFLAARAVGARVEVFSVGFGKRLWGVTKGDTDYRISLVPIGGYVRILGLGPDESDIVSDEAEETELLPRWQRALILVAGPAANILATVLFLAAAFMLGIEVPAYQDQPPVVGWVNPDSPAATVDIQAGDRIESVDGVAMQSWRDLEMSLLSAGGQQVSLGIERGSGLLEVQLTPERFGPYDFGYSGLMPPLDAVVVQTIKGSPAAKAGLKAGDRITAVNGEPVTQFYDLIRLISPHPNEEITVELVRDGAPMSMKMVPDDDGRVGIALVFPTTLRKLGFVGSIQAGVQEARRMTRETFRVIGKLLTHKLSIRQVSGPIDIARISGQAARSGIRQLIWFMGLISLQLGIFNLLPIPVLDGGHLTIVAIESAIRRDFSIRLKERILEVGFYLLLILFVVVFANDILKADIFSKLLNR